MQNPKRLEQPFLLVAVSSRTSTPSSSHIRRTARLQETVSSRQVLT